MVMGLSDKIWRDKKFLSLINEKFKWESPPSILVTRNPNWSQRWGTDHLLEIKSNKTELHKEFLRASKNNVVFYYFSSFNLLQQTEVQRKPFFSNINTNQRNKTNGNIAPHPKKKTSSINFVIK
jgi:hypothetical protein